jgi:hypothetical protein
MSSQPTNLTPKRTAYDFGDVNTRYKSRGEILNMQEQWNTFERVENYNDVIYQLFELGFRSNKYYVFASDQEFKNYRAGQQLHIITYPTLNPCIFNPISERLMPDVPTLSPVSYETNVSRCIIAAPTPIASETAAIQSDLEVYTYVSTYNTVHRLKYQFVDDEEKTAYERAYARIAIF